MTETPPEWHALAVTYLDRFPHPVTLLAKSCPGAWRAMLADGTAQDDGSEEAEEARIAVVLAAIRFVPRERGWDFATYANRCVTHRVLATRRRERLRRHDRLPEGVACPRGEEGDADTRHDFEAVVARLPDAHREAIGRAFGLFGCEEESCGEWAARNGTNRMVPSRRLRAALTAVRELIDGKEWVAS